MHTCGICCPMPFSNRIDRFPTKKKNSLDGKLKAFVVSQMGGIGVLAALFVKGSVFKKNFELSVCPLFLGGYGVFVAGILFFSCVQGGGNFFTEDNKDFVGKVKKIYQRTKRNPFRLPRKGVGMGFVNCAILCSGKKIAFLSPDITFRGGWGGASRTEENQKHGPKC